MWQSFLIGGKPSSVMAATVKPVSFASPSLCVSQRPSPDNRFCSSGILTASPARLLYVGFIFAFSYVYSLWTLSGSGMLSVTPEIIWTLVIYSSLPSDLTLDNHECASWFCGNKVATAYQWKTIYRLHACVWLFFENLVSYMFRDFVSVNVERPLK